MIFSNITEQGCVRSAAQSDFDASLFTFKNPIFAPKNDIDMFTIIGLMLTGMLLGYLLRKRDLKKVHPIITLLIWLLLFILGIEVGSNEEIIRGLHTIGYEAVVLTLGGTLGSVIAAWALWRALYKRKGGRA